MLIVSRRIGHQGDYQNRRYSTLGGAKAFLKDLERDVAYVRQRDVGGYFPVHSVFVDTVYRMSSYHTIILPTKRGWIGSC